MTLIISYKDLDSIGQKYQTYYEKIDRLEDGYQEKVDMRNYSPFVRFCKWSSLPETQLQSINRNLGHASVEKQMQIVEKTEFDDLLSDNRKQRT